MPMLKPMAFRPFDFKKTIRELWQNMSGPGLIYGIIAAGVLIRLSGIGLSAFWYDESFSIFLARLPFFRMLTVASWEIHPPLWETVLWLFIRLFDVNEIAVRMPALLASAGSLWLFYRLTQYFQFSRGTQITALVVAAVSPYQIWMAQDARSYALQCFCYLLAIWFTLNRKWWGLLIFSVFLFYSNNVGLFYAGAIILLAIFIWPNDWLRIIGISAASLLAYSLWLPSVIKAAQLSDFSIGNIGLDGVVLSIYRCIFINAFQGTWYDVLGIIIFVLTLVAVTLSSIVQGISDILRKRSPAPVFSDNQKKTFILGWIAIGPLFFMTLISIFFRNVVFYRPLSAIALPLILWCAWVFGNWKPKIAKNVLALTMIALLILSLMKWSPASKGGTLRQLATFIQEQIQPGDIFYHATATSLMPINLYLQDNPTYLLDEDLSWRFLNQPLQDEFGFQKKPLESLNYQRAWIFWARDPDISSQANQRMTEYTKAAFLMGRIDYFQAAPIEIYLLAPDRP